MNRNVLRYCLLLFIGFTACKKKDNTFPVITLSGPTTINLVLNTAWIEPGYSASDDKSGDLTGNVEISGNINSDYEGTYVLTYKAADFSGNQTEVTRTIRVYNEAEYLAGTYLAKDTCALSPSTTYAATISLSHSVNKEFYIQNFGKWNPKCTCNTAVKMKVNGLTAGSAIAWGHQSIAGADSLAASSGGGTVTALSPAQLSLTYQWSNGTSTQNCTGAYTRQ
jgi:hypothetical protein